MSILWTVIPQQIQPGNIQFGTITATSGKWTYNGSYQHDEESDWSAWIDNNPPVVTKKSRCPVNEHQWADTGLAKTWCKKCDLNGRWVLGNVEITEEGK